jgi:hypothetical protein
MEKSKPRKHTCTHTNKHTYLGSWKLAHRFLFVGTCALRQIIFTGTCWDGSNSCEAVSRMVDDDTVDLLSYRLLVLVFFFLFFTWTSGDGW